MTSVSRVLGPLLMLTGVGFIALGFWSLFESAGTYGGPRYFWLIFVGFPVFWIGGVMTQFAFIGPVTNYVARQVSPAVNTLTSAATTAARSVVPGRGRSQRLSCPNCSALNQVDSRFCQQCGTTLEALRCSRCSQVNEPDARFCRSCGMPTRVA